MGILPCAYSTTNDTATIRATPMVIVWGADNYAENSPTPNPVASDYLLLSGTSGSIAPDIIAGNVFPFITGSLTPASNGSNNAGSIFSITNQAATPAGGGVLTDSPVVGALSATDSMTKFGMTSTTNLSLTTSLKRSFYIDSNTPFNLYAQSGPPTTTGVAAGFDGSIISLNMTLTQTGTDGGLSFGTKAQSPTLGGSGFIAFPVTLAALTSPVKVYGAGRKTASIAGSIPEQSVRFDATYNVIGGYGLELGIGSISIPVTYNIYIP